MQRDQRRAEPLVRHRPLLFVAEANRKPIRECLQSRDQLCCRVAPTRLGTATASWAMN